MSDIKNNEVSDSDTVSLDGKLYEMALASDMDGLTDGEIREELEDLSEDDDGINVTIKEGIKPNCIVDPSPPRVASVMVIPEATKRTMADLIPKSGVPTIATNRTSADGTTKKNRNKNGSAKKKKSFNKQKDSAGSLVSMLSKVTVSSGVKSNPVQGTPKRVRSPDSEFDGDQSRPAKVLKIPKSVQPTTSRNSVAPTQNVSYSDAARKTLHLKVCLADKQPVGKDLSNVKNFLNEKIEETIENRSFLPIFNACRIGVDGVYLVCSDYSCAEWLTNIVKSDIPNVQSKLIILPQDEQVQLVETQTMVRVVACVPSRKSNEIILDTFAQHNKNLNTEKWKITSKRYKGAIRSTIFMRIDKESFEIIKQQGNLINWILAETIEVMKEHQKGKPRHGKTSSEAPQATVIRSSESGGQKRFNQPSSSEVMGKNSKNAGLIRKDGSDSKNYPNQN